jgi:ABC-2 type transport system permease protein
MTIWVGSYVGLIFVIFSHTDTLAGLSRGHVLLVMTFYYLIQNIADIFFKDNFEEFGEKVRRGLIDFDLVKPVPIRMMAFFRQMRFDHISGLIITGVLFYVALRDIGEPINIGAFSLGLFYSLISVVLYWSILSIISTFVFWVSKNDAFRALIWNASQVARYPRQIFNGIVGKIFTYGLPLAVLASIPAEITTSFQQDSLKWYVIGLTLFFYLLSLVFWRYGLRKYSSAS